MSDRVSCVYDSCSRHFPTEGQRDVHVEIYHDETAKYAPEVRA